MFKFVVIFAISLIVAAEAATVHQICMGCSKPLEGNNIKEAESALKLSLSKIATGAGPSYRLVKINSASSQVVSGILYRINAVLVDGQNKQKTCNIRIHSQPWLPNGIEITFECPGEAKVSRKHSA